MTNFEKPITFIHTADWHIGNPFSRFERDMRKKLKQAIFFSIEMIFIYAQKYEIPLILCAGDIVDNGQLCPKEDLYKLFEIIKKYPTIRIVMIAGNHDPLLSRNIYSQVDKVNYPPNLTLVQGDEELPYPEWNMTIFASSLREKNGTFNPLHWLKEKTLHPERINIGLCHGSIKNETFAANNFPIEPDFAITHHLDYLALGDWHSYTQINPRTFYPGVPEPLSFDENGAILKITFTGPEKKLAVEKIPIAKYKWKRMEEHVFVDTFNQFKTTLETVGEKEIRELIVSGFLPLETYKTYKELLDMNKHRYVEIKDNVVVQPDDQALLNSADGCLRDVIQRLLELKKSGEPLAKEILNPYVSIARTQVFQQVEELAKNRHEIIDQALLKIYTYLKEKAQ